MNIAPQKQPITILFFLLIVCIFHVNAQEYVPFTPRLDGGNIEVRGDIIFVGNNILNRASESNPEEANTAYNGTANNNNLWMEYIDIDNDASTFSSSSAELNINDPSCSQVRYAGLYWAGTYPNERSTDAGAQFNGTPRIEEWNEIKFKVPGGTYVDLVADNNPDAAGQEDDIIMDGYQPGNPGVFAKDAPVICYKNITDLVRSNPDPNGSYTAANIRATRGRRNGSSSAGWVMVIIYENPNESGKFISTFDGYAGLSGSVGNVDVAINGFRTLPAPFTVNARVGVGALEGDRGINNDRFFIEANSSGSGFTNLSTGLNPQNNFFNSTITTNGAEVPTRTPYGTNTLGTDLDLFDLDNPFNNVLPNDETGATLRFTSSGDGYGAFLTTFSVEIIEPNIILEKKVNTPGGADITGQGVNLGQTLDYVLSFENIGNDDASNYTIRDVLPVNVSPPDGRSDFIASDFVLPVGVTYTYNAASREVIFTIPDNLVQQNDPVYELRMRVQVAENCFDFINACSDLIQNLAYSTYQGVENSAQITDDPSVTDFNACGFTVPGATNFLLDDLADCNFERTVELCGSSAVLNAGDGFDSYVWVRDDNGNGQLDATDTVITDGDPDNDPSTIVVLQEGTYIVDKIVADPCKGFKEIITVVPYGSGTIPNPIIEFFNTVNGDTDPSNDIAGEIVQCSVDNDLLPKLFLCGSNDTKLLQVNIVDAQSIIWEQLDEGSCSASGDDCANKALTCTWSQVGTGNNYTVNSEGQYRLSVTYQNGCTSRFYYNVFQNNLDIQYNKEDIVCNSPGNITITNLGNGYGYQLVDAADNSVIIPFSANNGPSFEFNSGENGAYIVEVTQLDISGEPIENACIFNTPIIGILDRDITYDVTASDVSCSGLGSIAIQINNANPNYEFELRLDDGSNGGQGTLIDDETAQPDNNFTFTGLSAGNYIVEARSDDGCFYSEQVTVNNLNNLILDARVSQHITCREGNILMDSNGGKTPHTYAIWSHIDDNGNTITSYPTPQDIPSSEFQTSQIFDIFNPGQYVFVVVDRNNCFSFSNQVTIEFRPASEFSSTSVIDVACYGESTGSIQFNLIDDNGFQLTYYLFDNTTFDQNNYDYANALETNASGYFPNLPSGDYAIVIAQRKGSASCDYYEYQSISGPVNALSGTSFLVQDYTCLQNGIIEARNVTGGTAPYQYSLDGINFVPDTTPNANRFENLLDGTYTITIRDANGCILLTDPIVIDRPNSPTDLNIIQSQITCPDQTVDLTVTSTNGTAPYAYEIIAPTAIAPTSTSGNDAFFNGLSPDTYTIRVTDIDGCFYEENYTINPIAPISISATTLETISCFGAADGSIRFNVNFQPGQNFTYTLTGPSGVVRTGGTQAIIDNLINLEAGDYTLDIMETGTNCTYSQTHQLEGPPSALTVSNITINQPTCLVDGSMSIAASGGWGGYTYTLNNPDNSLFGTNSTGNFSGLTQSGTYNGTVSDANNCIVPFTFDLNAAIAPQLAINPNSFCYDDAVGLTLTASILSGGDGDFEYNINGSAYSDNNIFTGLAPGTYTINVRDGNSCTDTATITIDPELTVIASGSTITACATNTDIDITAAGGDGNYVYAVMTNGTAPTSGDFVTTNPISVTGAGDYDVYVRDNNGNIGYCEAVYDINIAQDAPLAAVPTAVDVTCFGGNDGSISLLASGGEAPYTYSIDGGTTFGFTTLFNNLSAGNYDVRVRDVNNCEVILNVTIAEPAELIAESAQTALYTCQQLGEITVGSVNPTTGGSGNYQYSINGGSWSTSTTGGAVFTDLTDGTYTVQVRDANNIGCVISLPNISIAPLPTEPALSTSIVYNCDGTGNITVLPNDPGYLYSIDGNAGQASNVFNNVAIGTHTVTVDYGSDCTVETIVNVQAGNAFGASIIAYDDLDCNGDNSGSITFEVENFGPGGFEYSLDNFSTVLGITTVSPQTISSLSAGSYTITIRDVDNPSAACSVTLNQAISEPAPVEVSATVSSQATCTGGGTISADATGGTPSYQYQLEDSSGNIVSGLDFSSNGNNSVFSGLSAGDYIVRARDINGCEDEINGAITVDPPAAITFDVLPTTCYSGGNDGTIQVNVNSGNGGYRISLNGGAFITPAPSNPTTYTFNNLTAGTYTIDVTDVFGCSATQQTTTIEPQLTANALLTSDLTCLVDASITINANGGSGSYDYEWSNDGGSSYFTTNFTGNIFSTNTFGSFTFRITDSVSGCTILTNAIIVTEAITPIISSVTPTHVLCNGATTGSLDIIIDNTVGFPPYTINVVEVNGPTIYGTQTAGLPAGDYEVTITDDKGCVSAPFPATINEPNAINYSVNVDPISCDSAGGGTIPGSIEITGITGGTAEYTYYLTSNNPNVTDQSYTTTPSTRDYTFTVLEFGIYQVDIVDANGCAAFSTEVVSSPPNDLEIDVSTVTVDCATGGTAIVTVGAAVGSGDYEFAILDTFTPNYSSNYQAPDTAGGDTATFTGLTPGVTYTFVVRDITSNCYYFETADAPVNTPSNMTASLDQISNVSCTGADDGNISFTFDNYDAAATAVNYEIFNSQSNSSTGHTGSVAVNPPAGPQSVTDFGTLPPGEYYLLLSEVDGAFSGCSVFGGEFTIRQSVNILTIGATATNDNECSDLGTITAIAQYGTAPYEFQLELQSVAPPTEASWTGTNTSGYFDNLSNGDYTVYVKDLYGCIQPYDITVGLDPAPEISLEIMDECVEEGMFEVRITLDSPGLSPYQISVNGAAYQNITFDGSNQYLVSGLNSGLGQTFAVRDLNGCADTETLDIQIPLEFTVLQTVELDCETGAASNAEILIDVVSGSGNYEFQIDGPGTFDQARTVLPSNPYTWNGAGGAGNYWVTVFDLGTTPPNCFETVMVDIPDAPVPDFTEIHTDVSCNGASDGSITLNEANTGINPLNYVLTPMPAGAVLNGTTFENLPAGTYSVRGTGSNNCFTDIFDIEIIEPAVITMSPPTVAPFVCTAGNNGNNASITITGVTGGSGNYVRYEFIEEDDPNTATVEAPVMVQSGTNPVYTETNTDGGSYTINVYDSNGCLGTTTAVILPFDELISATAAVTNTLTCNPGNDGELTINAVSSLGDSSKFEYSIDDGASYQVSNIFGGLSAGAYNILVRHVDTGCIIATSETLLDPNTFTINVAKTSDVVCYGTATGSVNFALVDATYPGGFTWTIYDTNGTLADTSDDSVVDSDTVANNGPTAAINLPAGSYYVVISQDNNPFCENTEAFNIAGPNAAITAAIDVTDITCVPGNDGVIEIIDVAGGWGGYTYYVGVAAPTTPADFLPNPATTGLVAGTYQAWVRDTEGCEQLIQDNIVLADPTPISANIQVNQENCTNLQGEIEVTMPTGGQGANYTYQLIRDGINFRAPQNTRIFSGLGAGSYQVSIIDQWGCTFTTPAELLYEEMNITTTVDKAIDCTVNPGGQISLNVNGGSTNLEFEMTMPGGTIVTQTTGIFSNLTLPGTYSFVVRDLDTTNPVCERIITQELDAPVDPILLDATITNVSCFGGNDGSLRANIDPTSNVNPIYQYELYEMGDLTTPIAGPQDNPLFTGLSVGDYQVKIISGRGCEGIKNETITQPTQLLIEATATEFNCSPNNSVNTATVTVSILDGATTPGIASGTSPYLYSIDNVNYQTSNTFNITDNGAAQTITVFVTDGKGCPTSDSVTVQPLNTFTASVVQDVAITCTQAESVTITVTDNGLPHNYSFELLPIGNVNGVSTGTTATTATTATFDIDAVGSYTFRVTDLDTGCYVITDAYTVAPFDFIVATATSASPVTCFDADDGVLQLGIDGYIGAFSFEVFTQAGTSVRSGNANASVSPFNLDIPNLAGGNYFVRITETDAPFCSEITNSITINSPDINLTAVIDVLSEPTCTNDLGEIRIVPNGGYAPYDITMTNGTDNYTVQDVRSISFDGLAAGNYTITVTDDFGCIRNYMETLNPATPIAANATPLVTNLACFGDTGATVTANVTGGGSGSYEYQLNYYDAAGTTITFTTGQQVSPDFSDLGAGIYSITVTDGWNCDVVTNTVEITQPTEIEAVLIRTDPLTCATGVEFELSATGGSGTYEYSVDNVTFLPMTSNPIGLPETGVFQEGTYQYYVRDAINGCEASVSNAITEDAIMPLILTVDRTAAVLNCTGESTAIIYASAEGGLGNYAYELYTDSSLTLASRIAGPQSEGVFRNLASGTYYVAVTSEDCNTQPEEVIIAEPTPLSFTESVSNVTCAGANDGQITVTLSGGAGGYQYAISPNLNQFDTTNTFTDLEPGDYTIIAQDQNGCFEYLTYTIIEPEMLAVTATNTPEICVDSQDGTITLNISGGTAPYSTALNSNEDADFVLNRTDFFDMAAGNYLIFVRDANGCDTNVVVDIERGVNLNAIVEPIYECSGAIPSNYVNITLEDDSEIGDVLYALDSVDPADFQLNPDFRNSAPGSHFITIAHSNGCLQTIDFVIDAFEPLTLSLEQRNMNEITAIAEGGREEYTYYFDGINNGNDNTFYITRTDTFEVRVVDQNGCEAIANIFMEFIDIELPNFFTPDGDGENDFWIPRNMEQFPEILIKIFDRYGRVVANQSADSKGWDGLYSGKELPTGDYWYVVKLNGERDEREFVGHFTLYR